MLYQARVPIPSEEEGEELALRINPSGGWAIEERDGLWLLLYLTEEELPKVEELNCTVEEAPSWEDRFRESFRGQEVPPFFIRPP